MILQSWGNVSKDGKKTYCISPEKGQASLCYISMADPNRLMTRKQRKLVDSYLKHLTEHIMKSEEFK